MTDKHQLAHLLSEIAVLLELKGENPFKIRAYDTAANVIGQMKTDIDEMVGDGTLEDHKGIGKAIGGKIREYAASGTIAYYEELKTSLPPVLFELVRIPGLGPKKALVLQQKLGIEAIGELEYACRENRLLTIPGFGAKTQERILQGIEALKAYQGRFLLRDAEPVAQAVADYLRRQPGVLRVEIAGSLRRRLETVKDIDLVVSAEELEAVMNIVTGMPGIRQIIAQGATKTSVTLDTGINVDVRVVLPGQFSAAWHHFTGSKEHHILLRGLAKEKGLKINEYGLENSEGQVVAIDSEEDLYAALGLTFIEPELREGSDETTVAATGRLPQLVTKVDIRGLFHVHTTYSDGSASLQDMAIAARRRGLEYLGITDHSRTAVYARGLTIETVREQRREIDVLNASFTDFTILAGIESDILADGSLDYPDEVLAEFDFVIASVHSAFQQSASDMTKRLVRAMENRYVTMLGHPTGRLLLAREGYALDMAAVIATAGTTGTIIEINSSPYRLDLDWRWCRQAREQGVLLALNPDAHAIEELDNLRYGLSVARKGWLTAADIVNTRSRAEVMAVLQRKRQRFQN